MAASGVIYTIGYGHRTIEEFTSLLQRYRIRYLVDVRSAPYSRYRPDFSKAVLQRYVEHAAIRYVFMGDLLGGRPQSEEYYTREGKVRYDLLGASEGFGLGLARLRKASVQPYRAAVMCAEANPQHCHRGKLLAPALRDAFTGLRVIHIDVSGSELDDEVLQYRLTKGQIELFSSSDEIYAP